jgi:DNA-nicking Smr family endonuclease
MARKKKKRRRSPARKPAKEVNGPFNPAFDGLAPVRDRKKGAPDTPHEPSPPPKKKAPDEETFFLEAMSDVEPLSKGPKTVIRLPDPEKRPTHAARDDELEGIAHLADLVSGSADMDITFSDEYIEGCVHGFSPKLMRKLKRGRFPIQDYVDLHGLTKQDAETRVREFLIQSHKYGLRCVLVVHGRGLNSENHIPVLKERLPLWLSRGPVKKRVLAFSTAQPYDGGTGAIYILLRRRRV